ncbi:MAG: serine dehydratase subunit alpha family protein, partial [Clostridia bacterium]|nr:serine dehydratase subunit alpha family protein [Clostridia bacterium]
PATGCTEPIAIAYAAAKAREVLGVLPETCRVTASGNIIKNVKSVVVPNTGGMRGIEAAAAAGIVAGKADRQLQVIAHVDERQRERIRAYRESHRIEVAPADGDKVFFIDVCAEAAGCRACVTIETFHTNVTRIEKNGQCLFAQNCAASAREQTASDVPDYSALSVERILHFADSVDLRDVEEVIARQIEYNSAIAREGLSGRWGAQIGRTLLAMHGNDVRTRARAAAAAGSDARMSGCDMPVVIVSGSGNQGMTASLPVIEYARELQADRERLYRSLVVSNLVTIHQKTSIGRLSAFCGAVSAGCGAAAGIAYLHGDGYEVVAHTIVNTLAILSGMVCDGAKPSCAAKIAMAVEAGLMGYEMYRNGHNEFVDGEGIVKKGVDNTIRTVGRMARLGMRETDREILEIMTGNC